MVFYSKGVMKVSNILIQESWIDKTQGLRSGDTEVYETYFEEGEEGKLFRHLQKEYGKCVSKVYIGDNVPIGWVFEKKEHYTDTGEPYTLETWVTLHKQQPEKTIKHYYHELS
jgi:hypothetical protein